LISLQEEIANHPVSLVEDPDRINNIKSLLDNGKTLLVTSEGFKKRGTISILEKQFKPDEIFIVHNISPNPSIEEIDEITQLYKKKCIKNILALGGGSVIDTAKALSITLRENEISLNQKFRLGENLIHSKSLFLIAIPTTAGTGSEVTQYATIWDKKYKKKYSLAGKNIFPDIALLCPELTTTLSPENTLYPALDTISHSMESLWNKNSTETSKEFSRESLKLSLINLPKALEDPNNLALRAELQRASALAGFSISITKTALAHSISYPLTASYNIPHGLACSFSLIAIYNLLKEKNDINDELLDKIIILLQQFDLPSKLLRLINLQQINALVPEMYNPERADNFLLSINMDDIYKIITNSFLK
jgi:alcohol dehydrogenase